MCNPLNILVSKLRKKVSSNVLHIQFLSFCFPFCLVKNKNCNTRTRSVAWSLLAWVTRLSNTYLFSISLTRISLLYVFAAIFGLLAIFTLAGRFLGWNLNFYCGVGQIIFLTDLCLDALLWSSLVMWGRRKMCSLAFVDITTSYFYW